MVALKMSLKQDIKTKKIVLDVDEENNKPWKITPHSRNFDNENMLNSVELNRKKNYENPLSID